MLSVSFLVIAFNQEQFVREACEAALAQDYPNLEIIFSDDASTDSTYDIMQQVADAYPGPHKILLNRNPANLGLIAHNNRAIGMSTGDLIVVAAGDDVSLPYRTSRLVQALEADPKRVVLMHSDVTRVDLTGADLPPRRSPVTLARPDAPLEEVALSSTLYIGATGAWTRAFWNAFDEVRDPKCYEDQILGFRAALVNGVAYVDEPLVLYRVGAGITTRPEEGCRTSLESRLRRRRQRLEHRFHMYRQRLADARYLLRQRELAVDGGIVDALEAAETSAARALLLYGSRPGPRGSRERLLSVGGLRTWVSEIVYFARQVLSVLYQRLKRSPQREHRSPLKATK